MSENDFDRRAGKPPEEAHPVDPEAPDPGDYGDPRVAQPDEGPPDEDAMEPLPDSPEV